MARYFSCRRAAIAWCRWRAAVMKWSHICSSPLRSTVFCAESCSNSLAFRISSARMRLRIKSASLATFTTWSLLAWARRRPSFTSSINARPACFYKREIDRWTKAFFEENTWREFCHSWEQSNMTNSTTEAVCLRACRPLGNSSCPCDPTNVLVRIWENSVKTSRRNGAMFVNVRSSFSLRFITDGSAVLKFAFGYSGSFDSASWLWSNVDGSVTGILVILARTRVAQYVMISVMSSETFEVWYVPIWAFGALSSVASAVVWSLDAESFRSTGFSTTTEALAVFYKI